MFLFSLDDIVAFFNKEQILDVMDCLDRVDVIRKAAKCWFKLNEMTQIQVNTAAGMTSAADAGDLVAGAMSSLDCEVRVLRDFFTKGLAVW